MKNQTHCIKHDAQATKTKRCRNWVWLFLIIQFGALGKAEASRKVIILAQAEAKCNAHLKEAYERQGYEATIALLDSSTQIDKETGQVRIQKTTYALRYFDLAYFRTWGEEHARSLAHKWQPIFEHCGVPCMDPLQAKLYTHNKHTMMRLFQENNVPMPKTLIVRVGTPIDDCIKIIREHFANKVVIKGEGSGGKSLSFINVKDEDQLRKTILEHYTNNARIDPKPLVLQQYVNSKDSDGFSYHYRILTVGDEIVVTMRFTATSRDIYTSNMSLGARAEMVDTDRVFSVTQQAEIKRACKLTGTNIAGVDATVVDGMLYIFEVNNSPGLNLPYLLTGSRAYIDKVATYSVEHFARKE
ncbi:MAG: hypothetical protein ROO73_04535 [Roseivirga sp.]